MASTGDFSSYSDPASVTSHGNRTVHYAPAVPAPPVQDQNHTQAHDDPNTFPITIFSEHTLNNLSMFLDPNKLLVSNWKYMASEIGFDNNEVSYIEEKERDPTIFVLRKWSDHDPVPTIAQFYSLIKQMNRKDVMAGSSKYIELDIENYRQKQNLLRQTTVIQSPDEEDSGYPSDDNAGSIGMTFSENTELSLHDASHIYEQIPVRCVAKPQPTKEPANEQSNGYQFDAFLIFDKSDYEFAKKLETKLTEEGFKVYNPYRDEIAGTLQFDSKLELMYERSRKVIVIVSDEVFDSGMYNWHLNILVGTDPIAKERKLIPVKYKTVTKRNILDHLCSCDITKVMKDEWFWNKLYRILDPKHVTKQAPTTISQTRPVSCKPVKDQKESSFFKKFRNIFAFA